MSLSLRGYKGRDRSSHGQNNYQTFIFSCRVKLFDKLSVQSLKPFFVDDLTKDGLQFVLRLRAGFRTKLENRQNRIQAERGENDIGLVGLECQHHHVGEILDRVTDAVVSVIKGEGCEGGDVILIRRFDQSLYKSVYSEL